MIATDTAERVNQTTNTAHHDAELVPLAPEKTRALTPPHSWQQTMAAQLQGKPALTAALVKAILDCPEVPNDAYNDYHKYHYTSSEAIFRAARQALAKNGIAPIPGPISVDGYERQGADRFELRRVIVLAHVSGESVVCPITWPICPDKGRPLDKATGSADTLSLRYFFRGLLMIACTDPEPAAEARDDTGKTQQPPQQPRPAPKKDRTAKPPPANGLELRERVEARDANLADKGRIRAGDLIGHVSAALARGGYSPSLSAAEGAALTCALAAAREFEQKLTPKETAKAT